MKILINGICGHMGREVLTLCEAGYRGAECIGGVDSYHSAIFNLNSVLFGKGIFCGKGYRAYRK